MSTNTASTQVITQADRSVKAVTAAIVGLSKVVAELQAQNAISEVLAADIQQKESQLNDLGREFELQLRTQRANLQVAVLENATGVMEQLMANNRLAKISIVELNELNEELRQARSDNTAAIEAAVKSTQQSLHAEYNSKLNAIKSENAVNAATATADNRAQAERITFLTGEIASLRAQIESERQARIEIAKADAGRQGVTVQTGKQ